MAGRGIGAMQRSRADWCLCTIPLSVLSQIEMNVSPAMAAAVNAVPYAAAVKIGLQFRRRFWEEDEGIYGGISYTDQPISLIGYPAHGYQSGGKGVRLGAYCFGAYAYEFTALNPAERVRRAVCAVCHMADGRGARGAGAYPSLVDDPRLAARDTVAVVLKRRKAMPPFARSLTDEQVAAVVGFICTHFGNALGAGASVAEVAAERVGPRTSTV